MRAAADGVVLRVTYLGVYGLTLVIDHGDKVATVYAHLSDALVHTGHRVRAGETVARVGCTGWCTGPHVHFETWIAGRPRNPRSWLP